MFNIEDLRNISFKKSNMGGYKVENVDNFVNEVEDTLNTLLLEKSNLLKKLEILAKKVEDYRKDEDYLRIALINAQKMSDASIREAKQKAEILLREAEEQANKTISQSKEKCIGSEMLLENMKKEVLEFKHFLLGSYKDHLKLINGMTSGEFFSTVKKNENKYLNFASNTVNKETLTKKQGSNNATLESTSEEPEQSSNAAPSEKDQTQSFNLNEATNKFPNLKFGDNYNISKDTESPLGLFK